MNGTMELKSADGDTIAEYRLSDAGVFDEAGALVASAHARPIVVHGHRCYGSWASKPIVTWSDAEPGALRCRDCGVPLPDGIAEARERSALVAAAEHRAHRLARGELDITPEVADRIRAMLTAAVHPPGEPVKPRPRIRLYSDAGVPIG